MVPPDRTGSVEDQAARWAARSAYGEMTPEVRAEFDRWLSADRRHRGAYVRARAGVHMMEETVISGRPTLTSDNDNGQWEQASPAHGRLRRWATPLMAGMAAVAVVALIFIMVNPLFDRSSGGEEGQVRQVVTLRDGSTVTLPKDARIAVDISASIRRITLVRGEATFKVAKDKSRPFVVRSGDVFAQATGTVYNVSRIGVAGGSVKVSEGSVLVWARDERDQAVLLRAGGELMLNPGPLPVEAKQAPSLRRLPPPELAQISLDNVTIASAAERFNRINMTKIVITDPVIGNTRIVGLFKANDPEQFVRAAAEITGASVSRDGSNIVINMK
ncbi:MAG: DUF4880 domain-containing protein [Sphingomonadales bacterium]|nr:MAG: DUF4880 domain-containing protein [Sphingomonadales bacterium]